MPRNPGYPGFGGGIGSMGDYLHDGTISEDNGIYGGGGSGYGGAIFIDSTSTLTISGPAVFGDNDALGGNSDNNGLAGDQAGTDLFMMTGSTVLIDPGVGNTVIFNGTIADDSEASIRDANIGVGSGAGLTVNSGLVIFNGVNTYTGQTVVSGGVLQDTYGFGVNANSNLLFWAAFIKAAVHFSGRWAPLPTEFSGPLIQTAVSRPGEDPLSSR